MYIPQPHILVLPLEPVLSGICFLCHIWTPPFNVGICRVCVTKECIGDGLGFSSEAIL